MSRYLENYLTSDFSSRDFDLDKYETTPVKFKKETVTDEYGNVEVRWWTTAETKHLPLVYAVKGYHCWSVYTVDGEELTWGLDYYSSLSTKAEAKKWIESFDFRRDLFVAEEKAEKEAEAAKYAAERAEIKSLTETFVSEVFSKPVPKVGDVLSIKLDNASKASNIGELLSSIKLGKFEDCKAEVVAVVEVDNSTYDTFARNVLGESKSEWFVSGDNGVIGGNTSYDPAFEGITTFDEIYNNLELRALYYKTKVELVHALVSPNKETIYINTAGYSYARYIGLEA